MNVPAARRCAALWVCAAALVLTAGCQAPGIVASHPKEPRPPADEPGREAPINLPDAGPAAAPVTCQPISCTAAGGQYCGRIGDGCGGVLSCGDCAAGLSCGGGGVKNVCGAPRDPNCKPVSCSQRGGRLCGRVGDGCGGELDCGGCPDGGICGAQQRSVCGTANGAAAPETCDNLCARRPACAPGTTTTLTGTVLAPTPPGLGTPDPIYNALVYVPNRPVKPFAPGASCDLCGTPISGEPITTALSGPDGKFILKNVPAGDDVPLVIQIGRWRRQVTVPKVPACTTLALSTELTRLPRNRDEGEIPQMAIGTGRYDPFECVLRKIGISDREFTPPTGPGRVHVYRFLGHGLAEPTPPAQQLVGDEAALRRYDIVILPCDDSVARPANELANLAAYTSAGGRLFLTDLAHSWLKDMGKFQETVRWFDYTRSLGADFDALVDETFPKGQAFADWLGAVGASPMRGRMPIHDRFRAPSYVAAVNAPTQRWLYSEAPVPSVQHFTFNTPIAAPPPMQCGRVVFSNFHVAEGGAADPPLIGAPPPPMQPFPKHCQNTPMTPQEKALEFMLFDASACILPDSERPHVFEPPAPPPPPPPPRVE